MKKEKMPLGKIVKTTVTCIQTLLDKDEQKRIYAGRGKKPKPGDIESTTVIPIHC